jgi:DNA-binding SARP family transcriptional activator/tetratricopeptide (TPR) repeat protein
MAVEFRLLGDVAAFVDGRPVELGHARQRCVLVALLVDANRTVPPDRVIDRVWADEVPQRARVALRGYLSRLRQALAGAEDVRIVHQSGGYLLSVDPAALDVHRFHSLVADARACDEPRKAADLYEHALSLWRGEALASLDTPWVDSVRAGLDAARFAAELERNDAALAAGLHGALLGELSVSVADHPLDERLAAQLMLALYRCGRQPEALAHFQRVRERLVEELGVDPSPQLQRLHQQILAGDPAVAPPARSTVEADRAQLPRQLPAPPRDFVARAAELAVLDALLAAQPAAVAVAALTGTAGVGKTALATHWAHRVADRFDGELYVNLRGFGPDRGAMAPAEALRGFLAALQVPAEQIPAGLDQQAALFRSVLADRRILLVLDNARDADQVRPLLPGSPDCVVVVTSRNQLSGLVAANGAHPLALDLFTPAEARELLVQRLGRARVAAEAPAIEEMIERCAGLPLALAVVAARAATHPRLPLTAIADELRHTRSSLDPFDNADPATDVRAVFSWSYLALGPDTARTFRLLGEHPGPDISLSAAASLSGTPPEQTGELLAELDRAHLVTEHLPGRFAMHDLMHAYAAELARTFDTATVRDAAVRRMLDHYLHSAYAADRLLYPHRDPVTVLAYGPGVSPEGITDRQQALAWFTAEHHVLLAAVEQAATNGFDVHAWQLAWTLWDYLNLQGHLADQLTVQRLALAAASRLEGLCGQAHAHRCLGRTHDALGQDEEAAHHLWQALDLFEELVDGVQQAQTHINLARMLDRQGHPTQARDHDVRSLQLYRAAGHLAGEARALNNLGSIEAELGQHRQAIVYGQQAITLNQKIGNQHGEATAWDTVGWAHHQLDQYLDADACFRRATALFREAQDRYLEADALTHLADTRQALEDPDGARELWQRALDIFQQIDHTAADEVQAKLQNLDDTPAC